MNITITNTSQTLETILSSTQKNLAIKIKGNQPNFTFIIQNQDIVNNILVALKTPASSGDVIVSPNNGTVFISVADLIDVNLITSSSTISAGIIFKESGSDLRIVNAYTGIPTLATGASTSALQTTGNTSLVSVTSNTANILPKSQSTMANSSPVVIASDQSTVPTSSLSTVTQGTVLGTTQVNLMAASVTSSSPAYVNGQISPISQTTTGALRVTTQGATASGASNGGNPNKIGGVFNTTQPTVTSAQTVDAQYSARGATIIATGAEALNTNVPVGTALNTYSVRITTNTTSTPTSATAYIRSISISTEIVGTTSTIKIQDKQGTPLVLIPALATTVTGLQTFSLDAAKMVSGIDIITAGAAAASVDVWINYYQ